MDVNYNGNDPTSWLWIGDRFIVNFPESIRFYAPAIPDPNVTKTIFVGAQRIWRTQDAGGDRAFLEAHCNTAVGEFPSDLLYTGACGSPADWSPLGASTLTGAAFGATKSGNNLSALARSQDGGTMWAGTGAGRVLISRNVNAAARRASRSPGSTARLQPNRAVSSIYADPTNAEPRDRHVLRLRRDDAGDAGPRVRRGRRPGHERGDVDGHLVRHRRPADRTTWCSTRQRRLYVVDRLRRAPARAGRRRGSRRRTACRPSPSPG